MRKTKHRSIGRVAANFLLNLIAYTHQIYDGRPKSLQGWPSFNKLKRRGSASKPNDTNTRRSLKSG
jgi:hypothetical protein